MKRILNFLFLFYFLNSFGQFAIVDDNDSFVNVRQDGLQNSKIIDKLKNGHLVYCFENSGNWRNIDYEQKGEKHNGYIYKDRYKLVSNFTAFKILNKSQNEITLKKDNIEISIVEGKFEDKKHTFKYVKNYPNQIALIDNKQYWGKDGGMPTTQFEEISIKTEQKYIILPKAALEGLYQPNISTAEVNYDIVNDTFFIQTMNSDGAGSYLVIWKVTNGIYIDRLVAYGF